MREETEKDILAANIRGEKYDEAVKRLFHNKEILAPVLKYTVSEYKDFKTEDIIKFIEEKSIADIPVEDIPIGIQGNETELSSISEKLIRYDVHFTATNPLLSDEKIKVQLHIDLEVQNEYYPTEPTYPIIKRALYYASREISQQLGTLTHTTNYDSLQKVYSIWICNENIPAKLQNTMTSYRINKEDILGITDEPNQDYDLMQIVVIRRGVRPSNDDIFQYLNGVFTSELEVIDRYVDIDNNEKIIKEVRSMSGLGQSIYENAKKEVVVNMLKDHIPYETISRYSDLTVDEIKEIEKESLQMA